MRARVCVLAQTVAVAVGLPLGNDAVVAAVVVAMAAATLNKLLPLFKL